MEKGGFGRAPEEGNRSAFESGGRERLRVRKKNYCQGVGGERDLPPSTSVGWVTVRTSREFTSVTKRNDPLQLISSSPVFFRLLTSVS